MNKGGLDATALAGMFITVLMFAALLGPLGTVVSSITDMGGEMTSTIAVFIIPFMLIAIIASMLDYTQTDARR